MSSQSKLKHNDGVRRAKRKHIAQRPNAFRLYRTGRLAELLDVDPSTIWKWRQTGILPEPVRIGGVFGWTEEQLGELMHKRREAER